MFSSLADSWDLFYKMWMFLLSLLSLQHRIFPNSTSLYTHISQGYVTGTGAIVWYLQGQWRNPESYGWNRKSKRLHSFREELNGNIRYCRDWSLKQYVYLEHKSALFQCQITHSPSWIFIISSSFAISHLFGAGIPSATVDASSSHQLH